MHCIVLDNSTGGDAQHFVDQIKRDVVDLVWSTVGRDHSVGEEGFCLAGAKGREVIPQSMIAGGHYFAPTLPK